MTEKYQLCLGHISPKTKECPYCIADEFNQYCPFYEGVTIYKIKVVNGGQDDQIDIKVRRQGIQD